MQQVNFIGNLDLAGNMRIEAMVMNFCVILLDKSERRENRIIRLNIFLLLNLSEYT